MGEATTNPSHHALTRIIDAPDRMKIPIIGGPKVCFYAGFPSREAAIFAYLMWQKLLLLPARLFGLKGLAKLIDARVRKRPDQLF